MRIQSFQPPNIYQSQVNKNKEQASKPEIYQQDTYVPSEKQQDVTCSKKVSEDRENKIQQLKKESEATYDSLKQLVSKLLERQGYTLGKAQDIASKSIEVDETARNEALALISADGPLGAEKVSNRIVSFAIAISGGDKSRLDELKGAIREGFNQVQNMLGGLPEVSMKTYDLIMEKLDKWEKEQ